MTDPVVGTARARLGLAGNPSDLYGGAVVATTFAGFAARVSLLPDRTWTMPDDGAALLRATIDRFAAHYDLIPRPARVVIDTDVPRQSGLAGSSAIVIACLRALADAADRRPSPFELAVLALAVEAEDLGVVAGAQDRVAQAYERPVLVDVAAGLHPDGIRVLDRAALPRFVVGWSTTAGAPSGDVHAPLRARWEAGDARIADAAARWRDAAFAAATAIDAQDRASLGAAMDATFDVRAEVAPIAPVDRALVETARRAGAFANQCGSGGAVVTLPRTDDEVGAVRGALETAGFATLVT